MKKDTRQIKTKEKALTLPQRRLIKGISAGLSVAEAARRAGYAESTIESRIYSKEMFGNVRIQKAIKDILDEQGLSDERLVEVLKEGIGVVKVVSAGATEIADHAVRHKFLETALKLKGHLPRDKGDADLSGTITLKVIGRK
jgi:phage terminase small subunit